MQTAEVPRRWAWPALGGVLAVALGLRLWGLAQGLPYAYNADEADHFVPHAVTMFAKGLNPHYFANPPGFTYLLHYLFALAYGGTAGVQSAFALHPQDVYTLARAAAAVLGALAVWLLYVTGARLFGRGIALLAAAIEAVAFLPVFYAHLALNDVPTLAPLTLSLLGSAGVLRKGRSRDHLLAGVGLGLACATKYTAGIALAPYAAALAARFLDGETGAGRRALVGIALAGGAALAAFLLANPYSVLDYDSFHAELVHQSSLSAEAQGKLGAPREAGIVYYLWSLTWGLGWAPALAALGGSLTVWRREARLGWMLVPAPVLFLAFMGIQGRYFGRWLLPIFPIACLLAACFAVQAASTLAAWCTRLGRRSGADGGGSGAGKPGNGNGDRDGEDRPAPPRRLRAAFTAVLAALLVAQGLLYSIHSGLLLSRADTRALARAWMVAHIPAGAKIVVEPVAPDEWARQTRPGTSTAANPHRWHKYPSLVSRLSPAGAVEERPQALRLVGIENYERTLAPGLLGYYERHGYCWVISGSTQSGRAFSDARAVPGAIAYYRALEAQGEVAYRASPYARGDGPVPFGFDWSFDYYPLAYHRPGPSMTVYRLRAGRCAR